MCQCVGNSVFDVHFNAFRRLISQRLYIADLLQGQNNFVFEVNDRGGTPVLMLLLSRLTFVEECKKEKEKKRENKLSGHKADKHNCSLLQIVEIVL